MGNIKNLLFLIACIAVDQSKSKVGWLTTCKGEEEGLVILDTQVVYGQEVIYRPFIYKDDDIIHGEVAEVRTPEPKRDVVESSDTGKSLE